MKLNVLRRSALLAVASLGAAGAAAQVVGEAGPSNLNIPLNPQFLTDDDPTVRKATAIVNGDVITATDVDQRMALYLLANDQAQIPPEEQQRIRAQVLRNLVDETLQIQAAEAADIKVDPKEIDAYFEQYARNMGRERKAFVDFLRASGTSDKSIKRQIHGELAWRRLQGREIEPFVNVADEEVNAVLERMNAAKGAQEFNVSGIFLPATPENAAEVRAGAERIVQQIRNGASFVAYARQFSEATTASTGGDLGWIRAERLPEPLSSQVKTIPVGQVSDPIPLQGGFSIVMIKDTRQVLMTDARDAVLSLKQMSVRLPAGTTEAQAAVKVEELANLSQSMGGCGGAEAAGAKIGAEVVSNDQTRVRDLPPALQEMLLSMSIGQATKPFGSIQEGVRVLVLCGRDDPVASNGPTFDQVFKQLEEDRINLRSRRYLRDLRRDAVVDYR